MPTRWAWQKVRKMRTLAIFLAEVVFLFAYRLAGVPVL
jgi:cell division protein FtsB